MKTNSINKKVVEIFNSKEMSKFKKETSIINLDLIDEHEYHRDVCTPCHEDFLKKTIERTGGVPVYPLVVVRSNTDLGRFKLISGASRMDILLKNGAVESEVIIVEYVDEEKIEDLIVDLNKQRKKEGYQLRKEFIHFMDRYPPKKGIKNYNRLILISEETGITPERVKKYIKLVNELGGGEYDFVVDLVFDEKLSLHQSLKFCELQKENDGELINPIVVKKLIDNNCDFDRLKDLDIKIDLNNEFEFEMGIPYFQNRMNKDELKETLIKLNNTKQYVDLHDQGKSIVPVINDTYITDNTVIVRGDSGLVDIESIFHSKPKARMVVGSCEYGYDKKRSGRPNESNHNELSEMNSQEFAKYTAEIYNRYVPYLEEDGSIYVIVYDYKSDDYNSYSCFTEHFVIEMNKLGLYLIGRKLWVKKNPLRRQYSYKDSVEGYEFIYRFSTNPKNAYTNPYLFMKSEAETIFKKMEGCTNHSNKSASNRGSKYFQSNLKKIVNTLDNDYCEEIIKGNVGNPGDFFRQSEEKKHSSTSPIYLTSTLILEGSKPGDVILDIWNGVGNSMLSSLLLGRKYVGIEIEENYYNQTIKKVVDAENFVSDNSIMQILLENKDSKIAA